MAIDRMLTYDRRVVLLAVAAGLPGLALSAGAALATATTPGCVRGTLAALVVLLWAWVVVMLRNRIVRPLQTVSNLLAALREDDFSIRARGATGDDALGQVMQEVNSLAETLRAQRLGAQEATALLRAVMAEIDVAIFAFDSARRLALVNQYGAHLLGLEPAELLGRQGEELGFDSALRQRFAASRTSIFPGASGRWEIRRRQFWQGGQPHELLVLADVSQPLREQERQAWQRLIRVIGHELNNSLAPIKSIAGSLNRSDRAARLCPTTGATTCSAGSPSSRRGPTRWDGSRLRMRSWRGCLHRTFAPPRSRRSSGASRGSKPVCLSPFAKDPTSTFRATPTSSNSS